MLGGSYPIWELTSGTGSVGRLDLLWRGKAVIEAGNLMSLWYVEGHCWLQLQILSPAGPCSNSGRSCPSVLDTSVLTYEGAEFPSWGRLWTSLHINWTTINDLGVVNREGKILKGLLREKWILRRIVGKSLGPSVPEGHCYFEPIRVRLTSVDPPSQESTDCGLIWCLKVEYFNLPMICLKRPSPGKIIFKRHSRGENTFIFVFFLCPPPIINGRPLKAHNVQYPWQVVAPSWPRQPAVFPNPFNPSVVP